MRILWLGIFFCLSFFTQALEEERAKITIESRLESLRSVEGDLSIAHCQVGSESFRPSVLLDKLNANDDVLVISFANNQLDYLTAVRLAEKLKEIKILKIAYIPDKLFGANIFPALECDFIYATDFAQLHQNELYAKGVYEQELDLSELPDVLEEAAFKRARSLAQRQKKPLQLIKAMCKKGDVFVLDRKILNQPGQAFSVTARQMNMSLEGKNVIHGLVNTAEDIPVELNLGAFQIRELTPSSSESFAIDIRDYLPLLWLLAIIGLIIEFNTPGFGIGGSLAVIGIALALFFQYQLGLASVLDLVLVAIGIALLAVEVFVIPGFGVAGILGILSFVAGDSRPER